MQFWITVYNETSGSYKQIQHHGEQHSDFSGVSHNFQRESSNNHHSAVSNSRLEPVWKKRKWIGIAFGLGGGVLFVGQGNEPMQLSCGSRRRLAKSFWRDSERFFSCRFSAATDSETEQSLCCRQRQFVDALRTNVCVRSVNNWTNWPDRASSPSLLVPARTDPAFADDESALANSSSPLPVSFDFAEPLAPRNVITSKTRVTKQMKRSASTTFSSSSYDATTGRIQNHPAQSFRVQFANINITGESPFAL